MAVKDIYLTCEEGTEALMPFVQEALNEIMDCFPEYKQYFPIKNLGNWKDNGYRSISDGNICLEPYKSIQWYIERAKLKAKQQGRWQSRGQISIDQLYDDLSSDPFAKKIPQMSLLITKHDLYGTQSNGQLLNFCNGVTKEGNFAIISTARFIDENNNFDIERFNSVVMHEFGHLIGLTPNGRNNSYEQLGTHCSNGDIMEQDMSGTGIAMTRNRLERKRRGLPPICSDCIAAGKQFFAREIATYRTKQQLMNDSILR